MYIQENSCLGSNPNFFGCTSDERESLWLSRWLLLCCIIWTNREENHNIFQRYLRERKQCIVTIHLEIPKKNPLGVLSAAMRFSKTSRRVSSSWDSDTRRHMYVHCAYICMHVCTSSPTRANSVIGFVGIVTSAGTFYLSQSNIMKTSPIRECMW